jgi:hypothetical protein
MDNDELTKQVMREDILEALMQFKPDKAPGPNGFTAHFYKICWYIIKFDLVRMTHYVNKSMRMGGATNLSFLSLIPKKRHSISFSMFEPISLCNVSYNIMSKIIATKL